MNMALKMKNINTVLVSSNGKLIKLRVPLVAEAQTLWSKRTSLPELSNVIALNMWYDEAQASIFAFSNRLQTFLFLRVECTTCDSSYPTTNRYSFTELFFVCLLH